MSYEFDEATAISRVGPNSFTARLGEGWGIWDTLNGGYLAAVTARAMAAAAGHAHPVSVTTHFLRPGRPGPADITTRLIRKGRLYSRVSADLIQDGQIVASLIGAFGELADDPGDLRVDSGPPFLPPPEECVGADRPFGNASVADRIDARIAPRDAGFLRGEPSGEMRIASWVRFEDERPMDPLGLLFLADSMPPPLLNSGSSAGWVPTLEMTTHVRRVPAPGWLRMGLMSTYATAGTIEEDAVVWDSNDVLVAQSRQISLLPTP